LNAILHNKTYDIPKEQTVITVDTVILKRYTGDYELAPNFILSVTLEEGNLMVQATGQGKIEVYAEKENLFFSRVPDAKIEFTNDANGKTDKLILHQNGRHTPAKKIK